MGVTYWLLFMVGSLPPRPARTPDRPPASWSSLPDPLRARSLAALFRLPVRSKVAGRPPISLPEPQTIRPNSMSLTHPPIGSDLWWEGYVKPPYYLASNNTWCLQIGYARRCFKISQKACNKTKLVCYVMFARQQ